MGRTLSLKHHRTMGLGLQAACIAQTCRLPGTTIRLAPTAKGLPVLSLPPLPILPGPA